MSDKNECLFCKIASREIDAAVVFEDDVSLGFLDHRPIFPGHTLLIPKSHVETLADLPIAQVGPYFERVQFLSRAVEAGMSAEGTFVALNNKVSQSVPHLHVHVVPRRKRDGLKGFFWPRTKYKSEDEIAEVQKEIMAAIKKLQT